MSCGSLETEKSDGLETAQDGAPELSPAEASRKQIAEAGGRWYRVLNVSICATWEEVKTAHKRLVLLHHPDKGGDPDTFRLVHAAYAEAQKKCVKQKVRMGLTSKAKADSPKKNKGTGKGKRSSAAPDTDEAKAAAAKADAEAKEKAREQLRELKAAKDAEKAAKDAERAAQAEAQAKAKAEAAEAQAKAKAEAKAAKDAEREEKARQAKAKAEAKLAQELERAAQAAGRGKKRARPKPVPLSASRANLQRAMDRLEQMDPGKKTMPEEIPRVSPEQVAAWINAGTCAPVDAREDHEKDNMDGPAILGASSLKYSQVADVDLLKDVASTQVARLQELQERGKQLVLFSCAGSTYDKCYLVASYLLDLFGFNPDLICRMQGGYNAWKSWLEADIDAGGKESEDVDMQSATAEGDTQSTENSEEKRGESQSATAKATSSKGSGGALSGKAILRADYILNTARVANDKATTQLTFAKKKLAEHENLVQSMEALEKATWQTEEERKAHVDKLWPTLTKNAEDDAALLDVLADAFITKLGERGFMHQAAFKELGRRFEEKAEQVQAALRVAADAAAERGKAVREAEAHRLDSMAGVHTSAPGATAATLGQWTLIGEINARRQQHRGVSP